MKHPLKVTFLALLLCLILCLFSVIALLTTPIGAKTAANLANKHLDALSIEGASGSWLQGIRIQSLSWRSDTSILSLQGTQFDFDLVCLAYLRLCIEDLSINALNFEQINDSKTSKSSNDSSYPIELPTLLSPIPIELSNTRIDIFSFNSDPSLSLQKTRLKQLKWWGSELIFKGLSTLYGQVDGNDDSAHTIKLDGRLFLINDYKVKATISMTPKELKLGSITLPNQSITLDGSLRNLKWQHTSGPELPISSNGWIKTLDENLPFSAKLKLKEGDTLAFSLDEPALKTQLNHLDITQSGYLLSSDGQPSFDYEAKLALKSFVYNPTDEDTKVVLEPDSGHVIAAMIKGSYKNNKIKIQHALLNKNSPRKTLEANTRDLILADGINFYGDLVLGKIPNWHINTHFQNFDLIQILPASITGIINIESILGPSLISGSLDETGIKTSVTSDQLLINIASTDLNSSSSPRAAERLRLQLSGKTSLSSVNNIALVNKTSANKQSDTKVSLQFDGLQLRAGADTIKLQGSFPNAQLMVEANLVDQQFFKFFPAIPSELSAKGIAKLAVDTRKIKYRNGSMDVGSINVNGDLSFDHIRYETLAMENITATISQDSAVHKQHNNNVKNKRRLIANIESMAAGAASFKQTRIELAFSPGAINIDLSSAHQHADDIKLSCSAKLNDIALYTVSCTEISAIATINKSSWQLQNIFNASFAPSNSRLTVGPFCLTPSQLAPTNNKRESVCLTSPLNYNAASGIEPTNMEVRNFLWSHFSPWLPTGFSSDGSWEFKLEGLALNADNEVSGNIDFSSENSRWIWQLDKTSSLPFTTPVIKANVSFNNNQLKGIAEIVTDKLGTVQLAVLPRANSNGHRVSLALQQINLALLNALYPITDQVTGTVQGAIAFNYLDAIDQLNGSISINDMNVLNAGLPIALTKGRVKGRFSDDGLNLEANFLLNEAAGQLSGQIQLNDSIAMQDHSFAQRLTGSFDLSVQRLVYPLLSDSWLMLNPKINIDIANQRVRATGNIPIERARIKIKQLPKQAIDISEDSYIEGENTKVPQWPVSTELKVSLSKDVRFEGFGLETFIDGNMLISKQDNEGPRGRGVLELREGSYQAYGQDLSITRGQLVFSGDLSNPDVRVRAKRNTLVDTVEVGLQIEGNVKQPELTLYSEPSMSEEAKLHYLFTGEAPGEGDLDAAATAQQAALALALSSGNDKVSEVADSLGIQDLRIGTASTDSGQELQVSGRVSRELQLRYGYDLVDQTNSITARYRISDNLYLELFSGARSAIDLLWLFSTGADTSQTEAP